MPLRAGGTLGKGEHLPLHILADLEANPAPSKDLEIFIVPHRYLKLPTALRPGPYPSVVL